MSAPPRAGSARFRGPCFNRRLPQRLIRVWACHSSSAARTLHVPTSRAGPGPKFQPPLPLAPPKPPPLPPPPPPPRSYITCAVQAISAFSDWGWLLYATVPAYAGYKLWAGFIYPNFIKARPEPQIDEKTRAELERNARRRERRSVKRF